MQWVGIKNPRKRRGKKRECVAAKSDSVFAVVVLWFLDTKNTQKLKQTKSSYTFQCLRHRRRPLELGWPLDQKVEEDKALERKSIIKLRAVSVV